jgi:hypothetical protein
MNAAVITETRNIAGIQFTIRQHLEKIPSDFELIIFHGKNKDQFKEFDCEKHEVNISSISGYNAFMTDYMFWKRLLKYDRVLIFEWDSRILREGIEEFYKLDYVGAPWKFQHKGGNGGLSLRNPRVMLETIERVPYHEIHGYEDVYFSNNMKGKLAPREVCEKFSVETIFKLGTWGCHAIENWLSQRECELILNQYDAA